MDVNFREKHSGEVLFEEKSSRGRHLHFSDRERERDFVGEFGFTQVIHIFQKHTIICLQLEVIKGMT